MNQYYIDDIPSIIADMVTGRINGIVRRIETCNRLMTQLGYEPEALVESIMDDIRKLQEQIDNLAIPVDMTAWEEECDYITSFMEDHEQ